MSTSLPLLMFWLQTTVDILSVIGSTGLMGKIILSVLVGFSIASWGVIISKLLLLRQIRKESDQFWKNFDAGDNLRGICAASENLRMTPLVAVLKSALGILEPVPQPQRPTALAQAHSEAALARSMQRSAAAQLTRLEHRMNFLATTASVTPFIGLLGTVWGVLTAFAGLANSNTATIRAVAPGIADALVVTAFGLFAAIPAVIAYNHFVYKIREIGGQMDDLQTEVMLVAERSVR